MSTATSTAGGKPEGFKKQAAKLLCIYSCMPRDVIVVLARVIVGLVFWKSGQTKVDGFSIKEQTFFLFEHEYQVPLIPPDAAAYMATFAEHVFPVLLWLGLATRLSATALLAMTLVIQTFVYPEAYVTHGLWAIGLLYLMKEGAGRFSLDHPIRRKYLGDH